MLPGLAAVRAQRAPAGVADAALAAPPRLGAVRAVAIDGPSGAGKSVLADAVVAALRARDVAVALVRTDHFATWEDPAGWWPCFESGVLAPLRDGLPGRYQALDWSSGEPRPGEEVTVPVPDVLVIEGVSSGRRALASELSLAVWVSGPDRAARLERAVARDGEHIREHLLRWQAWEEPWFAADDTEARADLAVW